MSDSRKPIVLAFVGYYLPGFKAGGILRSMENMVNHLHGEFQFKIVTRDRDLGDEEPYRGIKRDEWQAVGNASVYYVSPPRESSGALSRLVRETPHHVLYLNSFFEPLTIGVLLNRRLGRIGRKPAVLAPRGEFAWPSLRLKYPKKAAWLQLAKLIGLYSPVMWHASSAFEAGDVRRVMKVQEESIRIALDLPTLSNLTAAPAVDAAAAGTADGVRVVYLSRIAPEKNLHVALKILARVRARVAFDIIGPIEDVPYWNDCQRLLRDIPQNVTVRSLGMVKPADVSDTLSRYDLLLLPSGAENYGHVIAEALSVGTRVLIGDNTPWREMEARGLGWDLPLADKDKFAHLIDATAALSDGERARSRQAVTARMKEFFSESAALRDNRHLLYSAAFQTAGTIGTTDESAVSPPPGAIPSRAMQPTAAKRQYQACTRCIMDTSDSNIRFTSAGLCEYCENFDTNILPNWHPDERGARHLQKIAQRIREEGKGKRFDCIIGISGGLDSSYVTYIATQQMGLRPLLFHVDAGWNTDQAVGNIEKIVDGLGLDLYTEVIDWEEIKDLQVAFLKSQIPHQDIPQDTAFFATMYKFARQNNLKYIITGGNFSTECCREPDEWGAYQGIDKKLILDIHDRFGTIPLKTFPIVDVFVYKVYYRYVHGMRVVKPLDMVPYRKKDAEDKLHQLFGWKKFQHKHHESRFTRFFEDYWLPKKFGFDRRRAHFSGLIMTGQMTRAAALERIQTPELDEHFLEQEFAYVANKLDLTAGQLRDILNGPTRTIDDYRNRRRLIELSGRVMTSLGVDRRLYK